MRPVRNDRHGRRNDLTLESPKQTVDFSCIGSAIRSRCSRFTVNTNKIRCRECTLVCCKKAQGCKSLLKSLHLATAQSLHLEMRTTSFQVLKLTVKIPGPVVQVLPRVRHSLHCTFLYLPPPSSATHTLVLQIKLPLVGVVDVHQGNVLPFKYWKPNVDLYCQSDISLTGIHSTPPARCPPSLEDI